MPINGSGQQATKLLREWQSGDDAARDQLFADLYPWLNRAAASLLVGERNVSLLPSDLVHEAALRLFKTNGTSWQGQAHFKAVAAKVMRHVLIDHVRAKNQQKRNHCRVTLATGVGEVPQADLRDLHHSLQRLAALDPEKAEIVEMRYFGGMTIDDVAEVTGLSPATVKKRWAIARGWLLDAMGTAL